jgi:hypothetical protein
MVALFKRFSLVQIEFESTDLSVFEDVFEDEDEADILAPWFETLEFGLGFVSLVTTL